MKKSGFIISAFTIIISFFSCVQKEDPSQDCILKINGIELIPSEELDRLDLSVFWMGPYSDPEIPIQYEDLIITVEIFKAFVNVPNNMQACYNKWINQNPIVGIKLISNQDYSSEYPTGSDLAGLISFQPAPVFPVFFDNDEILDEVINTTDFNMVYCRFNTPPEGTKLHSFIMIWELENGSTLQSPAIEILVKP